ncbi:hypothetical protein [Nostoc sp.]|uniref:hypothetical protein n=1 Tax=Nostoc sp. TaxID=1180 RepID=UPI002FFB71B6
MGSREWGMGNGEWGMGKDFLVYFLLSIFTALPAAMRYILKAESYERKGQEEKLYCIA